MSDDPSTLRCHRCHKIVQYGDRKAQVQHKHDGAVYHLKCLPPNLFHLLENRGGYEHRVAPGLSGRNRLGQATT